jgi:hypothetical protein
VICLGARQVTVDETTVALKLLADRRGSLCRARTEVLNRLHQLLLELAPGGAKTFLCCPAPRIAPASSRLDDAGPRVGAFAGRP